MPTRRGWAVLFLLGLCLLAGIIVTLHPFLAVNDPVPEGILVVEGWLPDYGMKAVVDEWNRHSYERICVTGGPLDRGDLLLEHKTFAELGAATLTKLGLSSNAVQAVPAPAVRQDRTYTSALALKHWLRDHDLKVQRLNVISSGPHARRTRLLYQKAMGSGVKVGIVAVEIADYDARRWWASSSGVRSTTDELIAYVYARFLFWPSRNEDLLKPDNDARR